MPDNDRWRFDIELIRFLVRRALLTLKSVRSGEEAEDGAEDGFADLADDWRLALDDIVPKEPLPQTLWSEGNAHRSARLCRPEVCLAWGVLA